MVDLKKLELATGLSVAYTVYVPGRFGRFATRVLGPDATPEQNTKSSKRICRRAGPGCSAKQRPWTKRSPTSPDNTEEGFGRLDALNRIGNQVFATDLGMSGLSGFEKNLHAQDAPVSFPPIWTVPWFLFAQYDASIEQPLIRNAGEALGVFALVNLSPDYAPENLFRSSMALENLVRIEAMLRGPDRHRPKLRRIAAAEMAFPDIPQR